MRFRDDLTPASEGRRRLDELLAHGLLALEVDSRRAHQVAELVASSGCFIDIELCQDLTGRDRFVLAARD